MLRIIRYINSQYSYVDVPLCGAVTLTDDKSSVNGYPWIDVDSTFASMIIEEASDINYKGDNIVCTLSSLTTLGTWKDGDVVWVNDSSSLQLTCYVRRGSSWYKVAMS